MRIAALLLAKAENSDGFPSIRVGDGQLWVPVVHDCACQLQSFSVRFAAATAVYASGASLDLALRECIFVLVLTRSLSIAGHDVLELGPACSSGRRRSRP